jgi:alpha-ketoglutarate-dependent 2,4-dichlorophenoxyacetate dioxygenase
MALSVTALHPLFVGAVMGVDLRVPVDPKTFREIATALERYAVLVFPEQFVTDAQQIAFSGLFGPLEIVMGSKRQDRGFRLSDRRLADVSNLDEMDEIRSPSDPWQLFQRANELWHTDGSFMRVPAKISILSAREVPPSGGETDFADLRAAYAELDAATKDYAEGLVAEHSMLHSRSLVGYTDFTAQERAALPPVAQPVVRTHPGSGRKALYLGSHASHIIGLPVEQGRELLRSLTEFATQPRFVYRHHWQLADLVVWDNRCTLHRGVPYDAASCRRDMRRATIAGTET